MTSLCCPLCSSSLEPSGLEAHLRYELRYPLAACSLCPMTFCDEAEADKHFVGPFAKHPDVQPQLIKPPSDSMKEARLLELNRLATGGSKTVQERLCVCGQCRLLCREDFRDPLSAAESLGFRIKGSPGSGSQFSAEDIEQHREADSPDPSFEFADSIDPLKPSRFMFPGPEAARSVADESEPKDMSDRYDRCDRDDRQPNDQEYHSQQHRQPSQGEKYGASRRTSKSTTVRRNANPKPKASKKPPDSGRKQGRKPARSKKAAVPAKELHCRSCNKAVRSWDAKEHASKVHLRKVLHECKVCGYSVSSTNVGMLNAHVKKSHGQTPGPGTIDSGGLQRHAEVLKAMIHKLFDL